MNAHATDWILNHETVLWWFAVASILLFLVGLIAAPLAAIKIPADYFTRPRKSRQILVVQNPFMKAALKIVKNTLGYFFIAAGILMLVLPGQGVLTILIGVVLADFPDKDRATRWLVRRGSVFKTINWLRRRAKVKSLELDDDAEEGAK